MTLLLANRFRFCLFNYITILIGNIYVFGLNLHLLRERSTWISCYVHPILSRFINIHICATVIIVCNNISLCKQNDLPSTGNWHLNKCVTLRQNITCVCWRMFVEYFITYLVEFYVVFLGYLDGVPFIVFLICLVSSLMFITIVESNALYWIPNVLFVPVYKAF